MDRALLSRLSRRARDRCPELGAVSNEELEAFVVARVPPERLDDDVRAEDLLLACACAKGIRAAHDAVHAMSEPDIDRAHARIRPPITQAQARHLVWNRLLAIPEGGAARIALYKGENELAAYIRSVTSRVLLGIASQAKPPPEPALEDALLQFKLASPDPEIERVKQTYLPGLRLTLTHTLASLDPRERGLLRHGIVEQLGLDSLALLYGTTRDIVTGWLRVAREKLEYRAKNRLAERMRISDRDHASLARCVSVQLEAALARTLST